MSGINPKIESQRLIETILSFGRAARESQQVARRLSNLLAQRLHSLKLEHQRQNSAAKAERLALNDPRYLTFIEEVLTLNAAARSDRIQYETHMMLFEARRSRRSLLLAQRSQPKPPPRKAPQDSADS